MLEKYFESRFVLEQLRTGSIAPWMDGFAEALHEDGYSWWTARSYLRAARHLANYLERRGISLDTVQPKVIVEFSRHLKRCGCSKPCGRRRGDTIRGAKCFLRFLIAAGAVPSPQRPVGPPLICGFRKWLGDHRGASGTTVHKYGIAAAELIAALGCDPSRYDAKLVRSFFLERARRRGIRGTKVVLSAVRMFLRYLDAEGKCSPGLEAAVPIIAAWRLASQPYSLAGGEVERLLVACDVSLAMGLRDRAIILLLARLGLRASDVSALSLSDIDWIDGSVVVSGKNRREARIPLPQDVGNAVIEYLERRPQAKHEHVFTRSVAPFRPLLPGSVSQIVARAMHKAGVTAPVYGSHVLRHTAATEMLRRGVSLYDIAKVLRHRSIDTSAYYAKLDMELLRQVAQPWPEVPSC